MLFGSYKDAYLLQLSRYIHRNPIDMKQPMVRVVILDTHIFGSQLLGVYVLVFIFKYLKHSWMLPGKQYKH